MRDDLNGVTEVFAAPFLCDDRRVHLAGGDVRGAIQALIEEALIVADVEVRLSAVVGHKDLTVLERVHGAGIDVQIRIQLLHGYGQTTRPQQVPEA